jgi:protein TonB
VDGDFQHRRASVHGLESTLQADVSAYFINRLQRGDERSAPKCRPVPTRRQALDSARALDNRPEQFQKRGVYIGVFEQSLLIENATNKSWSFLASVSAELVAVSLLILIPLIYGDHLPEFHWRSVTVGAPPRQIERVVQVQAASGQARPAFNNPPRIANPITLRQASASPAAGPSTIEAPPGLSLGDGQYAMNPIGNSIGQPTAQEYHRPVVTTPDPPLPSGPIRVSQGVQMAKLLKQVIPVYPPMAKTAHISGTVHLLGIIAKDGSIRNLQVISGHPWLARAAVDAVSQWIYRPTLLSGEAVEVICPIDVNFTLSQ